MYVFGFFSPILVYFFLRKLFGTPFQIKAYGLTLVLASLFICTLGCIHGVYYVLAPHWLGDSLKNETIGWWIYYFYYYGLTCILFYILAKWAFPWMRPYFVDWLFWVVFALTIKDLLFYVSAPLIATPLTLFLVPFLRILLFFILVWPYYVLFSFPQKAKWILLLLILLGTLFYLGVLVASFAFHLWLIFSIAFAVLSATTILAYIGLLFYFYEYKNWGFHARYPFMFFHGFFY